MTRDRDRDEYVNRITGGDNYRVLANRLLSSAYRASPARQYFINYATALPDERTNEPTSISLDDDLPNGRSASVLNKKAGR